MTLNQPSRLPEHLHIFAEQAFLKEGVVINGVRYRIAQLNDLDLLAAVEQRSWGAGTNSEQDIAFSEEDIEGQLTDFPGLQVLALNEVNDEPIGWSCMIRIPKETDVENVPDSDAMYASRVPHGERFEAMGVAVNRNSRGRGVGRKLMIARQAGVAQTIVSESISKYGSVDEVSVHLDNIIDETSSTASIRMPNYGAWLIARGLGEDSFVHRQNYLDAVKSGNAKDSVLNANLAVVKETGGLAEIMNVKGGCLKDLDSCYAGLRGRNTEVVRAYAKLILERLRKEG